MNEMEIWSEGKKNENDETFDDFLYFLKPRSFFKIMTITIPMLLLIEVDLITLFGNTIVCN